MIEKSETVKVIPLQKWQDPQGQVVLVHSERECAVYFGCWNETREPAGVVGKLIFSHATASKASLGDVAPYYAPKDAQTFKSQILEVLNSQWINGFLKRQSVRWAQNSTKMPERHYHHYVISGHDNHCEIVAEDFSEKYLSLEEAGPYARLNDEA